MKKQEISILDKEDTFHLIGKEWMLVTAGTAEKFNTMTASWGGLGILWNKPVAFVFIRPERYTHEFIETNEHLTLSFYAEEYRKALQICGTKSGKNTDKVKEAGLTPHLLETGSMTFSEARLTLNCRKLFKAEMEACNFIDQTLIEKFYNEKAGGFHSVYVVEIEGVYTNEQ